MRKKALARFDLAATSRHPLNAFHLPSAKCRIRNARAFFDLRMYLNVRVAATTPPRMRAKRGDRAFIKKKKARE